MIRAARYLAITAILLAVTACSPDTTQSPPSSTVAVSLAPRVTDPLNVDKIIADPCASLTSQQRTELRLEPGELWPSDHPTDCSHLVDGHARAVVGVKSPAGRSLDEHYRNSKKNPDAWELWEPFEIDGYPAVRYNKILEDRSRCFVVLGVNDSRLINVTYIHNPDPIDRTVKEDTCARAEAIARAVLATARTAR